MKIAKTILTGIMYVCVAYAMFFLLWIFLMFGCTASHDVQTCNDNAMSDVARTIYQPLFN